MIAMKSLLRLGLVAIGLLLAPSSAWAAVCVTTAFAKTAGNWSGASTWVTLSGGAINCTLQTGDAVVFDSGSGAGTYTIDEAISVASVATSGATGGITLSNTGNTLTISGASFDISGVTYSTSVTGVQFIFSNTGATSIKTGAGSSNTAQQVGGVSFTGVSGVYTLVDNLNTKPTSTMTLTNGELDLGTNNVNLNIGQFSSSNSNTRSINGGSGTVTILEVGATTSAWDLTTATNFSLTGTALNITFAPSGSTTGQLAFITGAKTYGAININFPSTPATAASSSSLQIETVGPTFASLSVSGSGWLAFTPSATAYTITGAYTCSGQSLTFPLGNISATPGANTYVNLSIGSASTANYCVFINTKLTGAGTLTTTNSFDLGGNTGFTITPPSAGGGGHIIGGWLLKRDLPANDNPLLWASDAA